MKSYHTFFFSILLMYSKLKRVQNAITDSSLPKPIERNYAASTAGLSKLLKLEGLLIDNLRNYEAVLNEKIMIIELELSEMIAETEKFSEDAEEYLSNPLNSFSLIRHMYTDWLKLVKLIEHKDKEAVQINYVQKIRSSLPTKKDLNEALTGMMRIQAVYDLESKDMSIGLINRKQYDVRLSAQDCFAMGIGYLNRGSLNQAENWFDLALDHFPSNYLSVYEVLNFGISDIYGMKATVYAMQNQYLKAIKSLKTALFYKPRSTELLQKLSKFMQKYKAISLQEAKEKQALITNHSELSNHFDSCSFKYAHKSKFLNLHCRYNTTASPFLRLAPVKMEEISLDPYIVLFHELIYDHEVLELKNASLNNLRRVKVLDVYKNKIIPHRERVAKGYDMNSNLSATTLRINQLIEDVTGLNCTKSEKLQIINYGIGGQYSLHPDYLNTSKSILGVIENGDRIATVLIYLNDVEEGGATIFPSIGIKIQPKKGVGILWYNLDNSGKPNPYTMHSACPILVGSKWILTKWIRERDQLFRKPCYKEY